MAEDKKDNDIAFEIPEDLELTGNSDIDNNQESQHDNSLDLGSPVEDNTELPDMPKLPAQEEIEAQDNAETQREISQSEILQEASLNPNAILDTQADDDFSSSPRQKKPMFSGSTFMLLGIVSSFFISIYALMIALPSQKFQKSKVFTVEHEKQILEQTTMLTAIEEKILALEQSIQKANKQLAEYAKPTRKAKKRYMRKASWKNNRKKTYRKPASSAKKRYKRKYSSKRYKKRKHR